MGGMYERFGCNLAVALCERGEYSKHEASEWSSVVVATSKRDVDLLFSKIEEKIQRTVDGRVMKVTRELF